MVTAMAEEESSPSSEGKTLPDKVSRILGSYRKLLLREMAFLHRGDD